MGNVSNATRIDLVSNLTDIEAQYDTSKNLIKLAAHQIEDMLLGYNTTLFFFNHFLFMHPYRCILPNGDYCDESYFQQVFTDFGVCYTFNYNKSSLIQVQGAGNANALNLIFNLERYESMAGPFPMASLKVTCNCCFGSNCYCQ